MRLIGALIENENKYVLDSLLALLREDSFKFLVIVRSRINQCVERILKVKQLKPKPSLKSIR